MIRTFISIFFSSLISIVGISQEVQNPKFEKRLKSLLKHSVNEVDVQELAENYENIILLDAREYEEYTTSHIPGALYIGYRNKNWTAIDTLDKNQEIVVYCSVGYRSEKISEQLEKRGYSNVSNLYGSIFEWANCNLPMENSKGEVTDSLHTYNKKWSKWVDNPTISITW